ELDKFAS
nr:Chain C, GP41 PEPTIDE [Human immunodeficiency virus 1]